MLLNPNRKHRVPQPADDSRQFPGVEIRVERVESRFGGTEKKALELVDKLELLWKSVCQLGTSSHQIGST